MRQPAGGELSLPQKKKVQPEDVFKDYNHLDTEEEEKKTTTKTADWSLEPEGN